MTAEPELVLFPDDETPYDPVGSITIPAPDLLRALVAVIHAAGTDEDRPILKSVAIEPRETSDAVRFVAVDNYRIAMCEVDGELDEAGDWRGTVPAAVEDVKRLVAVLKSIPDVKAESCTARVVLTLGRRHTESEIEGPRRLDAFVDDETPIARLPLRVLDGLYPHVALLIPADPEHIGAFNARFLSEAAKFGGAFEPDGIIHQARSATGATGAFVFTNGRFTEIVMPVRTGAGERLAPTRRVDTDTGEIIVSADVQRVAADAARRMDRKLKASGTSATIIAAGRTVHIGAPEPNGNDVDFGEGAPNADEVEDEDCPYPGCDLRAEHEEDHDTSGARPSEP